MIEHHDESVQHILHGRWHQVQQKHRRQRPAGAAQQQYEPPQGKAGYKGHGQEDEEKHQSVAHVAGDHEIISHEQHGVSRHESSGAESPEVPFFLPQPLDLLGQQQHERDLHHLRRADAEGNAGEFQPGGVAGVVRHAEGRQQQTDEHDIEQHQPLPLFHQNLKVHHGQRDVHAHAQQQRHTLNAHIANDLPQSHVAGGAGDQHHAVSRGNETQGQQQQVRLLQKVL